MPRSTHRRRPKPRCLAASLAQLAQLAPLALLAPPRASAMDNGLARLPPMGWSSWNAFGGGNSMARMQGVADALVATGLRDLGYTNVALDGGWFDFAGGGLNSSGFPIMPADWDIKALAASFHAQNLSLGMYVTGGFKSVFRNEAKWAAVVLGEWGADGLKVDHMCDVPECIIPGQQPGHQMAVPTQQAAIERWAAAIAAVGRANSTLFQNCGVGCMPSAGPLSDSPAPWGAWCPQTANMWRSSGDIAPIFGVILDVNLASLAGRGSMSGPGAWAYPDSLEVGNARRGVGLTPSEARAHFSLWCVTSSPLILGMDVRSISADDLAVVSNRDAVAVSQAWAGFAGDMLNFSHFPPQNASVVNITQLPQLSVWWKPLPNASAAAVLLTKSGPNSTAASVGFAFAELQHNGAPALASSADCRVRSVWDGGRVLGTFSGGFESPVNGSSVVFVIIDGCAADNIANPSVASRAG